MTSRETVTKHDTNDNPAPKAFAYYRQLDTPMATGLRHTLERVAKIDLALPKEVIDAYGRSFDLGDRLGDAYIERAFADPKLRSRARKNVDQAIADGIDSVGDPLPELVAMFDQIDSEPDWVDWEMIEHGAEVFRRYGKELYPYFGMLTFVAYSLPTIGTPLALTGAYTGGSAFQRYLETARLWTDTTEPGAMRPGGTGRRSAILVRVLHSMIRHTLLSHAEWDRATLGTPISQAGMFDTLMASSQFPGQQLKLIGYRPTDDDIVAMMHHWRYVGHLMGVEPAWYPETAADGFRAMYLASISEAPVPTTDSANLAQSWMAQYLPKDGQSLPRRIASRINYQAQLGHARFYNGPEIYGMTGLPNPGLWRLLPLMRFPVNFARETVRRRFAGVGRRIDSAHRAQRQKYLATHLEGGTAQFKPVDELAR
jgi:hypothetical protein